MAGADVERARTWAPRSRPAWSTRWSSARWSWWSAVRVVVGAVRGGRRLGRGRRLRGRRLGGRGRRGGGRRRPGPESSSSLSVTTSRRDHDGGDQAEQHEHGDERAAVARLLAPVSSYSSTRRWWRRWRRWLVGRRDVDVLAPGHRRRGRVVATGGAHRPGRLVGGLLAGRRGRRSRPGGPRLAWRRCRRRDARPRWAGRRRGVARRPSGQPIVAMPPSTGMIAPVR